MIAIFTFFVQISMGLVDDVKMMNEQLREKDKIIFEKNLIISKKYHDSTVLKSYLQDSKYPSFVKKVSIAEGGKIEFRNWFLNESYEDTFGVTFENYEGKTDEEIGMWDEATVQGYYDRDIESYNMKDRSCHVVASHTVLGDKVAEVCKWTFELEGRQALAGMIVFK